MGEGRSSDRPFPFPRMPARAVEAPRVRVGFKTIVSLALCASAAGAALAHLAIDVVGDYALTHDSYDSLGHGSRELATGVALLVAVFLAARGLRICCEIAAEHRTRLVRPALCLRDRMGMLFGSVAATTAIVPGMEYLDGRLDGVPVHRLGDAFGGSIPLGLGTTLCCATFVALLVYSVARRMISYRDSIVTMIEILLGRCSAVRSSDFDGIGRLAAPVWRTTPNALRLFKRGPPVTASLSSF
jgi:hypothetical protein